MTLADLSEKERIHTTTDLLLSSKPVLIENINFITQYFTPGFVDARNKFLREYGKADLSSNGTQVELRTFLFIFIIHCFILKGATEETFSHGG